MRWHPSPLTQTHRSVGRFEFVCSNVGSNMCKAAFRARLQSCLRMFASRREMLVSPRLRTRCLTCTLAVMSGRSPAMDWVADRSSTRAFANAQPLRCCETRRGQGSGACPHYWMLIRAKRTVFPRRSGAGFTVVLRANCSPSNGRLRDPKASTWSGWVSNSTSPYARPMSL